GGSQPDVLFALSTRGVCPAGSNLSERKRRVGTQHRRWWTFFFDPSLATLRQPLADNDELQARDALILDLRRRSLLTLFGRIIWDVETQGIGHVCCSPAYQAANIPQAEFAQCCDGVVRILGELYRLDPHP